MKCKLCECTLKDDLEKNSGICNDCFFHLDCKCGLEKL